MRNLSMWCHCLGSHGGVSPHKPVKHCSERVISVTLLTQADHRTLILSQLHCFLLPPLSFWPPVFFFYIVLFLSLSLSYFSAVFVIFLTNAAFPPFWLWGVRGRVWNPVEYRDDPCLISLSWSGWQGTLICPVHFSFTTSSLPLSPLFVYVC